MGYNSAFLGRSGAIYVRRARSRRPLRGEFRLSLKRLVRSALVNYSAQHMFDLVNAIEDYPKFMDGCVNAQVLKRGEGWLEARLELQKLGLRHAFTTRNQLLPPHSMTLELIDGPFRQFRGKWLFTPLAVEACKVEFELEYEFASSLLGLAAGKWMEVVAAEQVDAICKRAAQVYGRGGAVV